MTTSQRLTIETAMSLLGIGIDAQTGGEPVSDREAQISLLLEGFDENDLVGLVAGMASLSALALQLVCDMYGDDVRAAWAALALQINPADFD